VGSVPQLIPLENIAIGWYKAATQFIEISRPHIYNPENITRTNTEMSQENIILDVVGQFAETELRKFYRAAEIGAGLLVITDCSGVIEYVNPAFCNVTGFTEDEAVGRTMTLLKSGRMSAAFYGRLWDTLLAGSEWKGEFFNRRKDESFYLERAAISPIKGADGVITHFIKVAEDITAQRYAEEHQLRRLKLIESINSANLHFIENNDLPQMSAIILETCMTLSSSPLGIIYELLPNGSAGVLALSTTSLCSSENVTAFKDIQYEIQRNGHYEVPLHASLFMAPMLENRTVIVNRADENPWKNCSCRICSPAVSTFAGFPLRVGATVIGMIGLGNNEEGYRDEDFQDFETFLTSCALAISAARAETIRKATLDQVRQSQKMEAIGQLAGGIAHDFNNLLTVISGYSTLASQKLGSEDPVRRDIEQVINASERATTLIRQLLAFGRRQILAPQPLNVNSFIAGLHKILSRLIGEHIVLSTNLAADIGQIKADPSQIEQIIMNLVINARDAMPRGGTITITTENHTIDASFVRRNQGSLEGEYALISVHDSGMGMTQEVITRIFEPFFTTKDESGTGLGLSTVYGIVKQNNGYIQVLSDVGIGSEFRVYLPRLPDVENLPSAELEVPDTQMHADVDGFILVVEDELSVLDLAAVTLRSRGYTVLTASGPLAALKLFDRYGEKLDLLISDVMMPDMTGPEMVKIMLLKRPDLKVLFMSGYSDEKLRDIDFPDEFLHFMIKPFSPGELVKLVHDSLYSTMKPPGEEPQ